MRRASPDHPHISPSLPSLPQASTTYHPSEQSVAGITIIIMAITIITITITIIIMAITIIIIINNNNNNNNNNIGACCLALRR